MNILKKGKFVIVDFRDMDFQKDEQGNIRVYDDYIEACLTAGMYEHENSWIVELKHNHIEKELKRIK